MDILAHGLWTNLAFYKKYRHDLKSRLLAVFFGIVPDLISFTPAFIYGFFHRGTFRAAALLNDASGPYAWARESYNYTHSLVTLAVIIAAILAIKKGKMYWPILGWLLHIVIDIFTHKGFYETPFLYPILNYKFSHGISWGHPTFMFINYGLLVLIYLAIFFFKDRRNAKKA